eukprot:117229-Hanusia_phi.AAC.1
MDSHPVIPIMSSATFTHSPPQPGLQRPACPACPSARPDCRSLCPAACLPACLPSSRFLPFLTSGQGRPQAGRPGSHCDIART